MQAYLNNNFIGECTNTVSCTSDNHSFCKFNVNNALSASQITTKVLSASTTLSGQTYNSTGNSYSSLTIQGDAMFATYGCGF